MPVIDTNLNVSFVRCTSAQYTALSPKDANAIYFVTDTREIYQGESLYSGNAIEFTTAVPEFGTAQK